MKALASFLAVLALAVALTVGASAQQQTFSTAHAGPTGPVPVITGQPVNGDVYPGYGPFPCASSGRRPAVNPNPNPRGGKSGRNPCTGARPSARPSPRPSARPTYRPPLPMPTHHPAARAT